MSNPPHYGSVPSDTPATPKTPAPAVKPKTKPAVPPPKAASQAPAAPAANLNNFPQMNTPSPSALPNIDVNNMMNTFNSMQSGTAPVNHNDAIKDIYGMMLHLLSKNAENDKTKEDVVKCVSRLDSIEAKVGSQDDPAIPLSVAVRFMPLPNPGQTNLQLIQ